MSAADVEFVKETMELFLRNERDAVWTRWAENATMIPPAEWPEAGRVEGREAVRATFDGFDDAFGPEWPMQLTMERIEDLDQGRILVEFGWKPSGASSKIPLEQPITGIYTVSDGAIAHGEFFLNREQGRRAADLE